MSDGARAQRPVEGRVRPVVLALLLLAQVVSTLALPGSGLLFLSLLSWRRARRSRVFVVVLLVVAVLNVVFLGGMVIDAVWGPGVGYRFS